MKKIFLAGIIQGSARDKSIHSQDYREMIKTIISDALPDAVVIDPYDGHQDSVNYDDSKGKAVFEMALENIRQSDLVIAFLPCASMGTAIELWECYRTGIPVWSITEMKDNWIVRFCSEKIFENIESFAEYLGEYKVIPVKKR